MSRPCTLKPGETVLDTRGGWTLVERPHAHRSPWVSLRLFRSGPGRQSLWLGARPDRMARLADCYWLIRNDHEAAAWVETVATARAGELFSRPGADWMRAAAYQVETGNPPRRPMLATHGTDAGTHSGRST